ncbi:MAG: hypothetical protein IJL37_01895 [Bacteroidaceae bacterium]|nr:hypothetical protein [Bacteroidaceae bacterium]
MNQINDSLQDFVAEVKEGKYSDETLSSEDVLIYTRPREEFLSFENNNFEENCVILYGIS